MSRIIVFNADDWGLSEPIHEAITQLHEKNAIDAAGIMMGQRYTQQAVNYARANPSLRVGLHLFASDRDCAPCSRPAWPRLWPEDILINTTLFLPHIQEIALAEVNAQLQAYKETGLPLHFINSHYHFHANHQFLELFAEQLEHQFPDFKGWLRLGETRLFPFAAPDPVIATRDWLVDLMESRIFKQNWSGWHNDTLWGLDSTFENDASTIAAAIAKLGSGFHEFFFHPGRGRKLTDSSTDQTALLELVDLVPQIQRRVSALVFP
ncbi:ChbG/HpnK family deacetylase [Phragmitibacter flavus]|uniref:ChbG/HpnK family deacetylase n=1 Tax=Phragmitibacter flavus TaxID=2576071 RepID=A0A5R8KAI4_9BACT|nr:ChbG/HpnK family deacetylase [Phragmitibacter flavus]TLD69316.1 ChbG/HpnK family deacetylase [Phragmitibacter flavus]